MKLYYKVFVPVVFALFMGACTCAMIASAVGRLHTDGLSVLLMVVIIAIIGFVTFLYAKMAWMGLRKISVVEVDGGFLIVRDAMRKTIEIRRKAIIEIRYNPTGFTIYFKGDNKGDVKGDDKHMKRTVSLRFMDTRNCDLDSLLTSFLNG